MRFDLGATAVRAITVVISIAGIHVVIQALLVLGSETTTRLWLGHAAMAAIGLGRKAAARAAREAGRELRDGGRMSIAAANLGLRGDVVAERI